MACYQRPRRLIYRGQKPTSSFIFLHDSHSSSTHLSKQLHLALKPKTIAGMLGSQTDILFLDAPIPTAQQHTWFSTTSVDDAASTTSWRELSLCMKRLDELVRDECERFGRENVFLVGVGMGFAVGAAYVVQMEERIGGLLGVGGWLCFHGELKRVAVYGGLSEGCFGVKRRDEKEEYDGDDDESEKGGAEKEEEKEEEKEGEDGDDDDTLGSGYSTPTLCEEHNEQASTSSLMLKRTKAFLEHILLRGKPPTHPRVCSHINTSTPILLVHGADNQQVSFTHAKEAQETLRHFGFEVTLRVVEGETHELSRRLMGDLMDGFMSRGLGDEHVRGAVGAMLLEGWL